MTDGLDRRTARFSLSALFILTAVVACVLGLARCLRPYFREVDRSGRGSFDERRVENRYYAKAHADLRTLLDDYGFRSIPLPFWLSGNGDTCYWGKYKAYPLYVTVSGDDYDIGVTIHRQFVRDPQAKIQPGETEERELSDQLATWWEEWKHDNQVVIPPGDITHYPTRLRFLRRANELNSTLASNDEFQKVRVKYVYPQTPGYGWLEVHGDVATEKVSYRLVNDIEGNTNRDDWYVQWHVTINGQPAPQMNF